MGRHRFIEVAAVTAYALLALYNIARLAAETDTLEHGVLLGACALVAWIAADFLSGCAHWAFDTWGSVHTPFLGPNFIRPFREHHVDPTAITRHDFIETNGASCIAALPVLAAASFVAVEAAFATHALLVSLAVGILLSNQCHKWAHADPARRGPLVRLAQRVRLVLSPDHHRFHHVHPFNSHFCAASGWLNYVLDRSRFFRALEAAINAVRGTRESAGAPSRPSAHREPRPSTPPAAGTLRDSAPPT